ncbi:MAG: glycoside hydrolase family 19 protein [Methylophilaceae bacterium]|nr:glycoside hydrolase family 19 protein [Methyloradius sp.]
MLTVTQLRTIMPRAEKLWPDFLIPLNSALLEFGIDTPIRQAAFLAQIAHESAELSRLTENLNYSAEGLAATWPNRFKGANGSPNALAVSIARNPIAIANNVYASRLGNGDVASGEGWKFKGRGAIQITGRDNYQAMSLTLYGDKTTLILYPDLLEKPKDAIRSACSFWKQCGANKYADKGDFDGVSDLINKGRKTEAAGDAIGYAERLRYYKAAKTALGVS